MTVSRDSQTPRQKLSIIDLDVLSRLIVTWVWRAARNHKPRVANDPPVACVALFFARLSKRETASSLFPRPRSLLVTFNEFLY